MEDVVYSIWKSLMSKIENCESELTVKDEPDRDFREYRKKLRNELHVLTEMMYDINREVKITVTNNKMYDDDGLGYIDFTVVKRKQKEAV